MVQAIPNHDVAIRATDLSKSFADLKAVDTVNFSVKRGEVFSLLGPNGAGKSTTISMLACLLRPDSGDATIMGHSVLDDPQAVKAHIGVVPQEIALYEDLSARENLDFWGKMYGLRGSELKQRVNDVLELIGLADRQKDRVEKFSGGMKRRVNIGVALLHTPDVIIMDEPTVGIDPQSRRHILDGVKDLNRQGVTVLYTTHYMEEAQELSKHIAIMDQGQIIASGTHDELVTIVGEKDRIEMELNRPAPELLAVWGDLQGVEGVSAENGVLTVLVDDSNSILPHLFETANQHDVRITSVTIEEPNLETVFLHLTGRALRD
jgi:ABC-2 type transport system ATP-binding protein